MAFIMRIGVDFEADSGSYIYRLAERVQLYGAARQTSARGKGWHGSGGGTERAHREKHDHATAPCTARAAVRVLRLRPRGERERNAVYVCKW